MVAVCQSHFTGGRHTGVWVCVQPSWRILFVILVACLLDGFRAPPVVAVERRAALDFRFFRENAVNTTFSTPKNPKAPDGLEYYRRQLDDTGTLSSAADAVIWTFGSTYLPSTAGAKSAEIPLPASDSADHRFVVFTEIPTVSKDDKNVPLYEVTTTGVPASTFVILKTTPCSVDASSTKELGSLVQWMAVRTGIYSYAASTAKAYIVAGKVDLKGPDHMSTVLLRNPSDTTQDLFTTQPVVVVQTQEASSTNGQGRFSLQGVMTSSQQLQISAVPFTKANPLPDTIPVAYLVMQNGVSFKEESNNLVLLGQIPTSDKNGKFSLSLTEDPRCGRPIYFGSCQIHNNAGSNNGLIPWIGKEDTFGSTDPLKSSVIWFREAVCPDLPNYATAWTAGFLSAYYLSGCGAYTLDTFLLSEVASTTSTASTTIVYASSRTIIWIALCTVGGVILLGVVLYFLCVRGPRTSFPGNSPQFDTSAPAWNAPGAPSHLGGLSNPGTPLAPGRPADTPARFRY